MSEPSLYKILVIDDNVDIHQDFINILTIKQQTSKIDALSAGLFGSHPANKVTTPSLNLQIDSAFQGQE